MQNFTISNKLKFKKLLMMGTMIRYVVIFVFISGFCSCQSHEKAEEPKSNVATPVKIVSIEKSAISEYINMNATTVFQRKNTVKSNVTGYVEKVFVNIGDYIEVGKPLFTIKTKESEALNRLNSKDSLFKFKGLITINAPSSGIVTDLNKLANDYTNDGDQLCVIADASSFVFLLNVPFEQNKYVAIGSSCIVQLPDSTCVKGTIASKLSTMDAVSQTQSYVIKVQTEKVLPENLIAIVQIFKHTKQNAQVLPKSCVLTDETMQNYWIMKLINDTTAVKIPITKGIMNNMQVEIVAPEFKPEDRIISSGNYGLSDTATINIIKK